MTSLPEPRPALDVTRLTGEGPELVPDLRLEVVEVAESTHTLVVQRAREGARDGLVVVADHQTAGRGRLDRTWESPAGTSVTFSLLLRPDTDTSVWPWIPLMAGYAVAKALRARGVPAGVKWPNDVLVGDLKVAGILAERIQTEQGPAAVVGVGINVAQTSAELPVPTATSLDLVTGVHGVRADRNEVLVEVLNAIREAFDAWEAGGEAGLSRLRESYAAACVTVGQRVRVDLPDGSVLTGLASGVDPTGRLVVETEAGLREVSAGDVVHVRPTDAADLPDQ